MVGSRGTKTLAVALCTLVTFSSAVSYADEVVISDDGRQIQINGDGTWVQLSKDRYAVNAAGQRVRLKPDGTWTLINESALTGISTSGTIAPLTPLSAASESTLHLAKVEILKRRIKRAKSIHAETSTVYHLQVLNDSKQTIMVSPDLAQALRARSSSGGEYPIESVSFDRGEIAPGERGSIQVVAKGAPQWFGVKYLVLEVAPDALGNSDTRILSKSMDDVEKRSVDSL